MTEIPKILDDPAQSVSELIAKGTENMLEFLGEEWSDDDIGASQLRNASIIAASNLAIAQAIDRATVKLEKISNSYAL